jgi:uncharacterized SAM-binding protein YcdF (DUF218 family)
MARTGWKVWLGLVVLLLASDAPPVRVWLTAPLVVSNPAAGGDAAYVLAGGAALRERLDAAADLIQMRRVPRLFLMRDDQEGAYSFKARAPWTGTEWALDYLRWRGVPDGAVQVFEDRHLSRLGTLDEARSLAVILPDTVSRLVLVTSPAHTRRSVLAFTRSLPSRVAIRPYAATSIRGSVEFYSPLSVEYLKLLLYAIAA